MSRERGGNGLGGVHVKWIIVRKVNVHRMSVLTPSLILLGEHCERYIADTHVVKLNKCFVACHWIRKHLDIKRSFPV